MTIVVFCGPTLPRAQVEREIATADVRPPAARGDVIKAVLSRPAAIAIVDGYFDGVPSVWHKEILWAMAEGVHVLGAASMGALRAAELHAFGMEGVGSIFESYRAGALSDDDEVAVAHASEEDGYRAASDAMVNMRATLQAAQQDAVICESTRVALETLAKGLFYPDRSYPLLLGLAEGAGVPVRELSALGDWLPTGRRDAKREDAVLLVQRLKEREVAGWSRKTVDYVFAHTDSWEALRSAVCAEESPGTGAGPHTALATRIVDELLVAGRSAPALDGAMARALSLEVARRGQVQMDARAIEAVADEFRRERGLLKSEEFDEWLRAQRVDEAEIVPYFRREATVRRTKGGYESERVANLADHLRATGEYGPITARAAAKHAELSTRGMECPELTDARLSEADLWQWFFVEKLHRDVPQDMATYAHGEQTDLVQLRSAVLRELLYLRLSANPSKT